MERVGVLFVCLGNICRSPMADGLFQDRVQRDGVAGRFVVESAGTAAYHVGELADPRTREVLQRRGIDLRSRARRVADDDFERFDWILAMDGSNLSNLRRRCPAQHDHKLHRVLDPLGGGDVDDPYYGGSSGFDRNCDQLLEAFDHWLPRMLGP